MKDVPADAGLSLSSKGCLRVEGSSLHWPQVVQLHQHDKVAPVGIFRFEYSVLRQAGHSDKLSEACRGQRHGILDLVVSLDLKDRALARFSCLLNSS